MGTHGLLRGRTMRRGLAFSIAVLLIVSAACSSTSSTTSDKTVGVALPMTLTSTAFVDGGAIPTDFSCDGRNISPPLSWSAPPSATQALVIVVDDQDVPFTHWALYDLPSGRSLPCRRARDRDARFGWQAGAEQRGQRRLHRPVPAARLDAPLHLSHHRARRADGTTARRDGIRRQERHAGPHHRDGRAGRDVWALTGRRTRSRRSRLR